MDSTASNPLFFPDHPDKDELEKAKRRVFTHVDFHEGFQKDLLSAKALALVQCPYISSYGVERMRATLLDCQRRGVRVCFWLQEPFKWSQRMDSTLSAKERDDLRSFIACVEAVESFGAHVTVRPLRHEKVSVIDERIFWRGSLNVLSHNNTSEHSERDIDIQASKQAISLWALRSCRRCMLNPAFGLYNAPGDFALRKRLIGQLIAAKRKEVKMSQRDVAKLVHSDHRTVALIEAGRQNVCIDTLLRICAVLELELFAGQRYAVPSIIQILHKTAPKPGQV